MKKIMHNTVYAIKPIWEIDCWYVIFNIIYTFENIPRRLINILITKYIVDAAARGAEFKIILIYGISFLTIELLLIVIKFRFLHIYKQPHEESIRLELKRRMMLKARSFDLACYDDSDFFNSYTKAFSALDNVAFTALNTVFNMLGAAISVITIISYIFLVDPIIIAVSLLGSAVSIMSNSFMSKVVYVEKEKQVLPSRKCDYTQGKFFDRNSAKDIRVEKVSDILVRIFSEAADQKKKIIVEHGKKKACLKVLFEAPLDISDMFMWLYIAHGIIVEKFQVGDFMSLSNAVWSLSQQIRNVFNAFPMLHENSLFVNDIILFEERLPEVVAGERTIDRSKRHILLLDDVCFEYEEGHPILKNVSFGISTGQRLAIVGQNGAGKSTLIKLLLRLYNPTSGCIKLDGVIYNTYDLEQLREQFAVVFQDYQYYAFSIAENVLMRYPQNVSEEQIILDALKKVGLYDKVSEFADGIYTELTKEFNKKGEIFSGGEYQKLAIARAIAKDAPILVMDEPSSALDPLVEKEISDLINEYFKEKIVIIISHKLSMTKDSDSIILLDKGRILEKGSHQELLERKGKYAELWDVQAEKYRSRND